VLQSTGVDSDALIEAVLVGQDSIVRKALEKGALPANVRREILVEYLLERDAKGAEIVLKEIKRATLPAEELKHVFIAAAEAGKSGVIRAILRHDEFVVDAPTLRTAFEAAVWGECGAVITMLGDTKAIPLEVKKNAITPSLFEKLSGPIVDGSVRGEMGLVEIQIAKAWRDKSAELREGSLKPGSKREIQRQEIFSQYDRLIEQTDKTIRASKSDSKELVVEMCTRELLRQRERALFELGTTKERQFIVKTGYNRIQCRATNPEGRQIQRSVAELVEALYERHQSGEPISWGNLINDIMKEWSSRKTPFTREHLSRHIGEIHPEHQTVSGVELGKWRRNSTIAPYRPTVAVLCEAFKLSPAHELMMWRISRGGGPSEYRKLTERFSQSKTTASTATERSKLVRKLMDLSGVPAARLREILRVQQLPQWRHGARIEDLAMCRKFVELTNPLALQPQANQDSHRELNETLVGILSDRPTSIVEAVTRAQSARYPGGTCFLLLTGRYGLKQIPARELSEKLGVSEWTIHRMRSERRQRGGHINEEQAHVIADAVQGIPHSQRQSLTVVERYERGIMVDTLTGVRRPIALWHQFVSGELHHVGEILKLTRIRRGQSQLPNTSDFELGKSGVGILLANKLADYLGFTGAAHRTVRREFVLRAMGLEVTTTPEDILNLVVEGQLSRLDGLRAMLNLSGRTRGQLAQVLGVKKTAVMTWVRTSFDGKISRASWVRALATELGMPHRADDMVSVFGVKYYAGNP